MSFLQGLFGPPNIEKMKAKRDVKGLIKALRSYQKDWRVQIAAAEALGEIGDASAVGPLIASLKESECRYDMCVTASNALRKISDVRAVEPLITLLEENERSQTSNAAFSVIANIGAPAVEPLIAALKSDSVNMRASVVVRLLGVIGSAQVVNPLISALKDEKNVKIRINAAEALGRTKDSRSTGPLLAALKDQEEEVRRSATKALDAIGWKPEQDEASAIYYIIRGSWIKCSEIGTPAVEPLIAVLNDGSWKDRASAAGALGKIKDVRSVEPLIAAVKDYDKDVCVAAIGALGEIKDARAVKPLIAALQTKNNNEVVYSAASEALVKIGAPVVEPLIAELKHWDWSARSAAALALGRICDPRAVKPLIAALNDDHLKTRREAAAALVKMYGAGKLGQEQKELILARRDEMIKNHMDKTHTDFPSSHNDRHNDFSKEGCIAWEPAGTEPGHTDYSNSHNDVPRINEGIGVDFPL